MKDGVSGCVRAKHLVTASMIIHLELNEFLSKIHHSTSSLSLRAVLRAALRAALRAVLTDFSDR